MLVSKENQKFRAISYTTWLNQYQSAVCAPLYQSRWFKHQKYNQPFEIKAQNPCSPREWRPQNYSGTGEILSQIVKKEMNLFEVAKKRSNNLEKLFYALITIKPKSAQIIGTREGFFSHGTICHKTQKQTEW